MGARNGPGAPPRAGPANTVVHLEVFRSVAGARPVLKPPSTLPPVATPCPNPRNAQTRRGRQSLDGHSKRSNLTAISSIIRMFGSPASIAGPCSPMAAGMAPLRCACRSSSVSNLSKMPKMVSLARKAYQVRVPDRRALFHGHRSGSPTLPAPSPALPQPMQEVRN